MSKKDFLLYYADDDVEDREIFQMGVDALSQPLRLKIFNNGVELLDALMAAGELPDAVVCDMKMHMLNGIEVLERIKSHPRLQHLPVIIFSTSSTTYDRELVNSGGGAAFITKPGSMDEYMDVISSICSKARHPEKFTIQQRNPA